jgi:SPP1 gp7 family putative phage head morphogenesis protein
VDAQTVKNLATSDQTLLPYKYLNGVKDVRWNTQKVNSAVLQGILQGESIPNLAKRLRSVTDMNKASSIRNARTAVTGAECKGRQDSYENATQDGIELKREWISAIDGRTRHAHRLLDGQLADVDKPFKSELGPIMFPGDTSADPANVYNCRCTIAAKVIGFNKVQVENTVAEKQEIFEEPKTFDELSKSMNIKISKKARELDFVTTKDALDGISWVERQFPEMKGFIEKIDSNKKGGVMNTTGRTIACSPSAFSGSYYKGNHLFFQRTGVHEAAHSAEGYLISKISKSKEEYSEMWNNHTIARSICKDALDEVLKTEYGKGKTARELYSSISEYATMSSSECMAEAVADVFEHKEKANPLSLVIFEQIKKRMKL